jgi:hypothetical protein
LLRERGSQYRDIGNEFDAARIHFSPTPNYKKMGGRVIFSPYFVKALTNIAILVAVFAS